MFTNTKIAAKYGVGPRASLTMPSRPGRGPNASSRNDGARWNRNHPIPNDATASAAMRTLAGRPNSGGPSLARDSFRFISQTKYRYWIECRAGMTYRISGSTLENTSHDQIVIKKPK